MSAALNPILGWMVEVFKPFIMAAMNSCHTKRLVAELLDRYVKTTDNDIDDLLAESVRTALLRDCN
jgi:hypothetical protein